MEVRVYFEGAEALKVGFDRLFAPVRERLWGKGLRLRFVAGQATAGDRFRDALRRYPEAHCVLLVDAEGLEEPKQQSLARECPGVRRGQLHCMVQVMEAWFLADREVLRQYYGDGFRENVLPRNQNVELIPKDDVISRLEDATRPTRKRKYHKTGHAPELLERLRPDVVRQRAPAFDRLWRTLEGLPPDS